MSILDVREEYAARDRLVQDYGTVLRESAVLAVGDDPAMPLPLVPCRL